MKPGWVAGSVRARLLADRRLAGAGARSVAAAGDVSSAVAVVAASPYGRDVHGGMGLVDAERGVRATALWHLRVLAGWLPPGGSDVVRVLAGGHEIANIEAHVDELAGAPPRCRSTSGHSARHGRGCEPLGRSVRYGPRSPRHRGAILGRASGPCSPRRCASRGRGGSPNESRSFVGGRQPARRS